MNSAHCKAKRPIAQVLATFVIAAASAAAVVPLAAQAMPGGPGGAPDMMGGHEGRGMGHMLERMLDKVDATEAQRTQIRQIAQLAEADMRTRRDAGRALREQGLALMTAPTLDAAAAESLRQQMLAQHDQASRRMMQAMLDIGNVLTPAQRSKVAEFMKKRHGGMHEHGTSRPSASGDAKS